VGTESIEERSEEMKTLLELLTDERKRQAVKHDLGVPERYAEGQINCLTQYEFLVELSEALEDRLKEKNGG
jgi:hypothetical protein